jgi:hypothetical protein
MWLISNLFYVYKRLLIILDGWAKSRYDDGVFR